MRHVPGKSCGKNQNTHFVFSNLKKKNCTVQGIMWKNIVERDTLQMTIWRMRFACRIPKAINTHSQYVVLIATTTKVARTRHIVTLYVHCLS
jgi:hypothetical protein